jgi:hypothetical protein
MANSAVATAGTNATATEYNNLRKDTLLGTKLYGTDTDGATVTFDMSDITKGDVRTVTLAGNRTLAVSNVAVGQRFTLALKQDGTGTRTVTWFSGISWPGAVVPTLTTTAAKYDVFSFICIASNTYLGFIAGQNL